MIGHVGRDADDDSTYSAVRMDEYLSQLALRRASKENANNVAVVIASGSILDGSQPHGKPVVASMGSVAASGGYWISMDADKIYASPTTITGSIGIVGMFPTFQRSLATIGVATDGVGTTPWSGQLRPDREMSDEARKLFQIVIDDGYRDFISGVASGRDLDVDYVDRIGQGQVWSGEEALANGLVDELGGLDAAITGAAELANLEHYGEKLIEIEMSPTEQLILDLLTMFARLGIDPAAFATPPSPIQQFANRLQALVAQVAKFNDPMGKYAHCFCRID